MYEPMPTNAPWPREICPLQPVRIVNPTMATARVPAIASWYSRKSSTSQVDATAAATRVAPPNATSLTSGPAVPPAASKVPGASAGS